LYIEREQLQEQIARLREALVGFVNGIENHEVRSKSGFAVDMTAELLRLRDIASTPPSDWLAKQIAKGQAAELRRMGSTLNKLAAQQRRQSSGYATNVSTDATEKAAAILCKRADELEEAMPCPKCGITHKRSIKWAMSEMCVQSMESLTQPGEQNTERRT